MTTSPSDSLTLEVERVEALLVDRLAGFSASTPPALWRAMEYSLMAGGKRLRPQLCLAFATATRDGALDATSQRAAEDAACAVELIHTYSLIHDDLPAMDDDDLRRGKPTSHKMFGEAMAILAGDALLTDAFTLVAREGEAPRGALCGELARAAGAMGMVGGQVLDVADDRPAELGYLFRLHRMKTGALIRAACRMGVVAARGNPEQLSAAEAYGDAVGLAFQIADDNLDVTSDAATLGKPVGADAEAGRVTFPALLGLAASQALAHEWMEKALAALRPFGARGERLAQLARYAVARTA
jgi:geranylgeranyl diphosphate synthase type II